MNIHNCERSNKNVEKQVKLVNITTFKTSEREIYGRKEFKSHRVNPFLKHQIYLWKRHVVLKPFVGVLTKI